MGSLKVARSVTVRALIALKNASTVANRMSEGYGRVRPSLGGAGKNRNRDFQKLSVGAEKSQN